MKSSLKRREGKYGFWLKRYNQQLTIWLSTWDVEPTYFITINTMEAQSRQSKSHGHYCCLKTFVDPLI